MLSATSFNSTSDSDVSPHTSAIVVDNNSIATKDAWVDPSAPEGEIVFGKKSSLSSKSVFFEAELICTGF